MKHTTEVKKQHTVPRFLLENFAVQGSGRVKQLNVFDKKSEKQFKQSILDATTRNRFYDIKNHPDRASLEPILGIYESDAAPVLRKIIEDGSLNNLSNDDKDKLATFIAVQRARTESERQRHFGLIGALTSKFQAMGAAPEEVAGFFPSAEETNNAFLRMILEALGADLLLEKDWFLMQTTEEDPFFISDSPITLHNSNQSSHYGNLGLASIGIQIYLPISSTLTLALFCPSIKNNFLIAKNNAEFFIQNEKYLPKRLTQEEQTSFKRVIAAGKDFENNSTREQTPKDVRFLNSLQVKFSEQFVYCQSSNFSLVHEMISNNPVWKQGHGFSLQIG